MERAPMTTQSPNPIAEAIRALEAMLKAYWYGSEDSDDEHAPSMVKEAIALLPRLRALEAKLAALAEVSAKATPGPWEDRDHVLCQPGRTLYAPGANMAIGGVGNLGMTSDHAPTVKKQRAYATANADLIARSVNLVRLLLGVASATPEEKAVIRYRAMIAAAPPSEGDGSPTSLQIMQTTPAFSDEQVEAMCRAHDLEDAAQKGEPSPWRDYNPADDDNEFRMERMCAMRCALEALRQP